MKARILVTPRSLTAERHPYVEELSTHGFDVIYCTPGATPSEEELLALAPDCVGWLAGVESVTPRVIEAAEKLVVISRNGVGVDNLPVDVLARKGVKVMIAGGPTPWGSPS